MPDKQNDGADGRMLTVADDDRRARGQCRHPHHLEEASPLAQMDTPTNACARALREANHCLVPIQHDSIRY